MQLAGEIADSLRMACADESTRIAAEHGFSFWLAGGNVLLGWGLASSGSAEEGIELLRQGLQDWIATESVTYQTYYLGLLADVLNQQRQNDEGLQVLNEALALANQTGEGLYEAELHRLRGEMLLQRSIAEDSIEQAEQCFHQALAVARAQHAAGLELRAATSAARSASDRGQAEAARGLLEPLLSRISEGRDTPDDRAAQMLIEWLELDSVA